MKKLLLSLATAFVAMSAMAFEIPETGYWLCIWDQYGIEHDYQLFPGADGDYTTTLTLYYNPWGEFYWDPNLSDAENEANRPQVPYCFVVNGVRYGAPVNMQETMMGEAHNTTSNPLVEGENLYTVPVGFAYVLGVYGHGSEEWGSESALYVYCAQAVMTTGIDEMNANKTVANVRYYNMAGQEMQQADGMTIVVTTYTDGTTKTAKVVK